MPSISDCVFLENHAEGTGGALDVRSVSGHLDIQRSTFYRNTACGGGGAIAISAASTVLVADSKLLSNTAVVRGCAGSSNTTWSLGPGGGIYQDNGELVTIINTVIESNTGRSGGGVFLAQAAEGSLINSTLKGNLALMHGGGLSCDGCAFLRLAGPVQDNVATEGAGAYIEAYASPMQLSSEDIDLSLSAPWLGQVLGIKSAQQQVIAQALEAARLAANNTVLPRTSLPEPAAGLQNPQPQAGSADLAEVEGGSTVANLAARIPDEIFSISLPPLIIKSPGQQATGEPTKVGVPAGEMEALPEAAIAQQVRDDPRMQALLARAGAHSDADRDCLLAVAQLVDRDDVQSWLDGVTRRVHILGACVSGNKAELEEGLTGLPEADERSLLSYATSGVRAFGGALCGIGNGGGLCIVTDMQDSIIVAKSLLANNSATFGGGVFLTTARDMDRSQTCDAAGLDEFPLNPVTLDTSRFVGNTCADDGLGSGPAVFWNAPYVVNVTCALEDADPLIELAAVEAPDTRDDVSSAGPVDIVSWQYCERTFQLTACDDWRDNVSASEAQDRGPQRGATPPPTRTLLLDSGLRSGRTLAATVPDVPAVAPGDLTAQAGQRSLLQAPAVRTPGSDRSIGSDGWFLTVDQPIFDRYASGSKLDLAVTLRDAYGTVVNTSALQESQMHYTVPTVTVQHSMVSGTVQRAFDAGYAEFADLKFIAKPGVYKLHVLSNGLQSTSIKVSVRECLAGEVNNVSGDRCTVCRKGTFSSDPASIDCQVCPAGAVCYGSSAIVADTGYFQTLPLSSIIYRCPNAQACTYPEREALLRTAALHMSCHAEETSSAPNATDRGDWILKPGIDNCLADALQRQEVLTPNEVEYLMAYPQCTRGYQGRLCGSCLPGHSSSRAFECVKCTSPRAQALVMVLAFTAVMLLLTYTIRATMFPSLMAQGAGDPSNAGAFTSVPGEGAPAQRQLKSTSSWLSNDSGPSLRSTRESSSLRQTASRRSWIDFKSRVSNRISDSPQVSLPGAERASGQAAIASKRERPSGQASAASMDSTPRASHTADLAAERASLRPVLGVFGGVQGAAPIAEGASDETPTPELSASPVPEQVPDPLPGSAAAGDLPTQPTLASSDTQPPGPTPEAHVGPGSQRRSLEALRLPSLGMRRKPTPVTSSSGAPAASAVVLADQAEAAPDAAACAASARGVLESCAALEEPFSGASGADSGNGTGTQQASPEVIDRADRATAPDEAGSPQASSDGKIAAIRGRTTLSSADGPAQPRTRKRKWMPRLEIQMAKIVISFLQVVTLMNEVNLWPKELEVLFKASGQASAWGGLVAWDCLLPEDSRATGGELHPEGSDKLLFGKRVFTRVLLAMLLPVMFLILWLCIWIGRWVYSRIKLGPQGSFVKYFFKRFIVTSLCIAFVFYPIVVAAVLSIFSCVHVEADSRIQLAGFDVDVESGQYWSEDTSVPCWEGDHRTFVLYAGIPGVIFWCLGIPLTCFYVLFHERTHLHDENIRAFLGFLYAGYKLESYYWEVVIMLRKLLMVAFVKLFVNNPHDLRKIMLSLGVIWMSVLAQSVRAPYFSGELNNMEMVSLTATGFTLYASSFYVSEASGSRPTSLPLSILSFALLICNSGVMIWFAWKILGAGVRSWLRQIGVMHHEETKLELRHLRAAPERTWTFTRDLTRSASDRVQKAALTSLSSLSSRLRFSQDDVVSGGSARRASDPAEAAAGPRSVWSFLKGQYRLSLDWHRRLSADQPGGHVDAGHLHMDPVREESFGYSLKSVYSHNHTWSSDSGGAASSHAGPRSIRGERVPTQSRSASDSQRSEASSVAPAAPGPSD